MPEMMKRTQRTAYYTYLFNIPCIHESFTLRLHPRIRLSRKLLQSDLA